MAGGFFLIRSHVADATAPALLDFLAEHVPEGADVGGGAERRVRWALRAAQ